MYAVTLITSIADINATPVNSLKNGRYASNRPTAPTSSASNATSVHLEAVHRDRNQVAI